MIPELQDDLKSQLTRWFGAKLRKVAAMPTSVGADLLRQFAADAPCFYLGPMGGVVQGSRAAHRFFVLALAKHPKDPETARVGDGQVIGLYKMLDLVMALADSALMGGWQTESYTLVQDDALDGAGLQGGLIIMNVASTLDDLSGVPEGAPDLPALLGLTAFIDIPPAASDADHAAWLAGQPGTQKPDITTNVTLEGP